MTRTITLRVEKPCGRSWSEMIPESRAGYCSQCRESVHDLDSMSQGDILALVKSNPDGFCGKISSPAGICLTERPDRTEGTNITLPAAILLFASTVAACSGKSGQGTQEHSPEPPAARSSSSPAVSSVDTNSSNAVTAPSTAPSPPQLSREQCERLSSLGYVSINCATLPSREHR